MNAWPHQLQGVADTLAAITRGERKVCLTSPTGGGKSLMMQMLARDFLNRAEPVVLYSNRKMLIDQLSESFDAAGIDHGILAAGHGRYDEYLMQIASLPTIASRTLRRKTQELPRARLVIVDEGHLHTGPTARKILGMHLEQGAAYVLVTATPLDLEDMADELVVAGNQSQLRACGALVPAIYFGPDEPDLRRFKNIREGVDLTEWEATEAIMTPGIFGRVLEYFNIINPERRPSILFAPSVEGSIWFAQHFAEAGIRAAHIDGADVWIDGQLMPNSPELRKQLLQESKDGRLTVLCNRFVLREGIDAPWLSHGIFATVFGSVQSYLQSGGRLLRAYPGLDHVTIQDHGGNWWRHGSLNDDRSWHLGLTAKDVYQMRADRMRRTTCVKCDAPTNGRRICAACGAANATEPLRCPQCSRIIGGGRCPCGYAGNKFARVVTQSDGRLVELNGKVFKPRRITQRPDGPKLWERMYYRSRTGKGARTFRAAMALFASENNWGWPDPKWPFMPRNELDTYRLVGDVPREDLY